MAVCWKSSARIHFKRIICITLKSPHLNSGFVTHMMLEMGERSTNFFCDRVVSLRYIYAVVYMIALYFYCIFDTKG